MRRISFRNFWSGFNPDSHLIGTVFQSVNGVNKILGPFETDTRYKIARKFKLIDLLYLLEGKADFFVTGENREPQFERAKKQIGFWRSYPDRDDVFRFPYWMWYLDWPELEHQPPYPRYGMRLSIDRLMRPIRETYSKRQIEARIKKAVLFSKHLHEPRKHLFELTKKSIGCDGFGGAFGNDNRQQPKMPMMERYRYSLCPENSIGDGYITEKIPEAFHSGCVPIGWCRPEDLAEDFNPKAVVNLFGLDDHQISEVLTEITREGAYYQSLISAPLLQNRPRLGPLIDFITGEINAYKS